MSHKVEAIPNFKKEAKRLMPPWTPAWQNGTNVYYQAIQAITFTIWSEDFHFMPIK